MKGTNLFIVFEGPNSVGKTTFLDSVFQKMRQNGKNVSKIKFPSSSDIGQLVRRYAQPDENEYTLATLVAADFYATYDNLILPKIQSDQFILCDRYTLSPYVYQKMQGIDVEFLDVIFKNLTCPDLTFVLFASEEVIRSRRNPEDDSFSDFNNIAEEIKLYAKAVKLFQSRGNQLEKINAEEINDSLVDFVVEKICESS